MEALKIVISVLLCLVSVALIAIVTLQSGKEAGLSGALAGGKDSYLSKSKTGALMVFERKNQLAFAVLALALNLV